MPSDERRAWLLGDGSPVRVIPAGLARNPAADATDQEHTPLHLLDRNEVEHHDPTLPDHQHHIIEYTRHPSRDPDHDHRIRVSVSHPELLHRHLPRMSAWIRAAPPAQAGGEGDHKPLYLPGLVDHAVASVTRSSIAELWGNAGDDPPGDLNGLLGDLAGDVRHVAASALADGLAGLVAAKVLHSDDLHALHPELLIDALLSAPHRHSAAPPAAGGIVTTILQPPGVHHVHYSVRIAGQATDGL